MKGVAQTHIRAGNRPTDRNGRLWQGLDDPLDLIVGLAAVDPVVVDPGMGTGTQHRYVDKTRHIIRQGGPRPISAWWVEEVQFHHAGIGTPDLVVSGIRRVRLDHRHPHGVDGGASIAIRVSVENRMEALAHSTGIESPHGVRDARPTPASPGWVCGRKHFFERLVAIRWIGGFQIQIGQFEHVRHPGVAAGAPHGIGGHHRHRKDPGQRLQLQRHIARATRRRDPFQHGAVGFLRHEGHRVAHARRSRTRHCGR